MDEKSVRPGRACRRTIPGAAASGRNPLRPPCGPDRRPSPQHRGPEEAALIAAIVASLETRPNNLLRPLTRTGCASNGAPRTRRAGDGSVRRMARRMRASSPQVYGCAVGEPLRPHAHPEHTDVLRTCSRGQRQPTCDAWRHDPSMQRRCDEINSPATSSTAPAARGRWRAVARGRCRSSPAACHRCRRSRPAACFAAA